MQRYSLARLVDTANPAWPEIQARFAVARNRVEVLNARRLRAEEVLLYLQVTTRSYLGSIAFETGGLLIDYGWLRFLGAGHENVCGDLLTWNSEDIPGSHHLSGAWVVAYDVVGGFFALNNGVFPGELGTVFYFSPGTLQWESLNFPYTRLLTWAIEGDINVFYQGMRWPGWEADVSSLKGDQGIHIYPWLFTERKMSVAKRSRRAVPVHELWHLYVGGLEK